MNRLKSVKHLGTRLLLVAVFILPLFAGFATPVAASSQGDSTRGTVYTMTNATGGNKVVVFQRSSNGSLSRQEMVSTGGRGNGVDLGSQGSVILSSNGRWLFVVNAGSNEISMFSTGGHGLQLVDIVDSGGVMPVSLTMSGQLLYVVNAGGSGNISGFQIHENGKLTPLKGSTQPLSNGGSGASPMPAQISFHPTGNLLVVTEKATNLIDTYELKNGVAGHPATHPSAGMTPFGFAFDNRAHLIVSEAFMNAPGASALSSYAVDKSTFQVISASVGTTQTAACWVVISKDGKYAFDTNAVSGSISSFQIGKDGSLTLSHPQAGLTGNGSGPNDMALSNNGRFLYAIGTGSNAIHIFQVKTDGSLKSLGSVNVPATSFGLAAR